MSLGEKIKEARIAQGMTQAQLADGKITRNMLSQIETGKARPSLETIYHISERLGVDVAYFLGNNSRERYVKFENIEEMKRLYKDKKYESCIYYFEKNIGFIDDETALILTESYFHIGETNINNGYPSRAKEAFARSLEYAEKTAYSTDSVRAKIALLQPIATNIQSPRLQLDTEKYIELRERVDYSELFHYLSDDYKYRYTNEIFIHIAAAREAMKAQNFSEAIKHLSELDDNKTKYKIPAYVLFRLYVDLEGCYKELKNFELAYKYSSKRIALISAFNL